MDQELAQQMEGMTVKNEGIGGLKIYNWVFQVGENHKMVYVFAVGRNYKQAQENALKTKYGTWGSALTEEETKDLHSQIMQSGEIAYEQPLTEDWAWNVYS